MALINAVLCMPSSLTNLLVYQSAATIAKSLQELIGSCRSIDSSGEVIAGSSDLFAVLPEETAIEKSLKPTYVDEWTKV